MHRWAPCPEVQTLTGSTRLAPLHCTAGLAGGSQPEWVVSIPLGCLAVQRAARDARGWRAAAEALLEAHGGGLSLRLQPLRAAAAGAPGGPAAARASGGHRAPWRLVMTGGTVTTAAAVQLALPRYAHDRVHLSRLSAAQVLQLAARMEGGAARARRAAGRGRGRARARARARACGMVAAGTCTGACKGRARRSAPSLCTHALIPWRRLQG